LLGILYKKNKETEFEFLLEIVETDETQNCIILNHTLSATQKNTKKLIRKMNAKQENFCVVRRRKKICGVMGNREARESS